MAEITVRVEYRRRRKSFELKWLNPNELRVRVPLGTSRKAVDQLIADKSDWIAKSRKRIMEREVQAKKDYLKADAITYLGESMPLHWERADHPFQFFMEPEGFVLSGTGTSDQAQALIEAAYRDRARTIFQKRAAQFAKALDVQPNQIRVKAQKTRWGSCSSKGNLNFNWHALVAPPEVVDYLVVHEVCHLVHMNHSTAFWDLVASIRPNYREERDWLKKHDTQILP